MGELNGVPVAALLPVFVLLAGFVIFCWWDIARQDSVNYLPKWLWAIICVISVPLGGIIYLLVGRKG
ncbi:MAG: PLDc N-terminal domain-containing protein [Thermomicrobiales bacterium]